MGNRKGKYVTIKDVAGLAGVSVATVSYVLNNKKVDRITDETRQKVLQAAKELNYRPNIAAQNLKSGKSYIIGLVLPRITDTFYAEIAEGVECAASEKDYRIALFVTHDDLQQEKKAFEALANMRVAGILVSGIRGDIQVEENRLFLSMERQGIPIIQVDRYYDLNGLPSVSNDDYKGSYEMTKWLIGATGKKVALMMPDEKRTAMEMRSRGFIDASLEMESAQNNRVYRFTFSENNDENMRHCVDEMVAEGYQVIYDVTGDQNTIEVIRYLNKKGLRVPDEISVAGYDGINLGDYFTPKLTTVQQPIARIGAEAVRMLDELLSGIKLGQKSLKLENQLVIRDSVKIVNK